MPHNAWIGPSALDDWRSHCRAASQLPGVDVVLITHPRDEHDLPRLFPWAARLSLEERRQVVRHMRPVVGEVIETPTVRAGILFMPFFAFELLDTRRRTELRRMLETDGLQLAAAAGARVVSLGGLTGALSGYGRRLVTPADELGVVVTTGQAATAVSVFDTLELAVAKTGGSIAGARVSVLGVGGVGGIVAQMIARARIVPDELVLADRPQADARLGRLAGQLATSPVRITIEVANSEGVLPAKCACYDSDVVVSAVSVPEVIDISKVRPGTVLVDDSQPNCWPRNEAWQRVMERGDILPCEAGLVNCEALGFQSHFPFDFADHGPEGSSVTWSCLAEGLLLAIDSTLPPTRGEPNVDAVQSYRDAFATHRLRPALLQCGPHLLDTTGFARRAAA